jgi:hypothetical protein
LRGLDQDGYQEAVAGVEGVGQQGEDVSGEGAEEAEDQDRTRDRDGHEVREHPDEGDLIEGGATMDEVAIWAARETAMRLERCSGGLANGLSKVFSTRD